MIAIYSLTIFIGAALLFAVQPLFARLVLPLLGGAPAVWNASLVFFQATLLAGYAYAHLLGNRVRPARQGWVHAGVLLLAVISLPIAIPAGWTPPTQSNPVWWLLAVAAVGVGLPFFAVSATSPLLQRWFSRTDHPAAHDPYFLYAASNLGSLIALVGYPVIAEPLWTLPEQSRWWTAGYGVLVVLVMGCAVAADLRRAEVASATQAETSLPQETGEDAVGWGRRLRWLGLAFVPSSLMLSVTSFLTTDLAAVPLLWVVPLGIYLVSFILVFARRQWLRPEWLARAFPFVVVMMVFTMLARASKPMLFLFALHLGVLFVVSMVCHGAIAKDRPPARFLTEMYLWMSAGGVLGGVFNALVAPVVFTSVLEYPVTLVLACLLLPGQGRLERRDVLWPVLVGLTTAVLTRLLRQGVIASVPVSLALMFAVPPVLCFALRRRPVRFGLGVAAVLAASAWAQGDRSRLLHAERSFFGIHRVYVDTRGETHRLLHGSTSHGAQSRLPERRGEPLLYYTRSGPLGQLMAVARHQRVALVGLGAGATACYAEPGDDWTYYEIDPTVERIARDRRFFTYLGDCRGKIAVTLGDARLTLREAPAGAYQMLILDAYSSDAIPMHLITREALALYLGKVSADGVLVWHITNRHVDLEPVVAALARDAGLVCRVQNESDVLRAEAERGKSASRWVVMARDVRQLGALAVDPRWKPAQERPDVPVWTDDYANLVNVLRWFRR